jgi:hypothetical protein
MDPPPRRLPQSEVVVANVAEASRIDRVEIDSRRSLSQTRPGERADGKKTLPAKSLCGQRSWLSVCVADQLADLRIASRVIGEGDRSKTIDSSRSQKAAEAYPNRARLARRERRTGAGVGIGAAWVNHQGPSEQSRSRGGGGYRDVRHSHRRAAGRLRIS